MAVDDRGGIRVWHQDLAILTLTRRYSVVLPTCLSHKTAIETEYLGLDVQKKIIQVAIHM